MRVPYALSEHGEEEIQAVVEVLRRSTMAGPSVKAFEEGVSEWFGKKKGVMVNSGSSALLVALKAFDLPEGSEVITPALTFSTTVATIVQNRLVPAFVDADIQSLNILEDKIEEMITARTRAIVVPNLMGNIPDWDRIREIADKYNLMVLEDSADTIGVKLRGTPTGTRSDITTTSFYGAHIINAAGNGGMVLVDDPELEKRVRTYRGWGRRSATLGETEDVSKRFGVAIDGIDYDAKFVFDAIGYNFEPSEMGAAFGLEQLKKLPKFAQDRRAAYDSHYAYFTKHAEFFHLPSELQSAEVVWYAYPVVIKDGAPFTRTEMQMYLEERGIQTRPVFAGNILRQPGFAAIARRESRDGYPNADFVTANGLVIGCHQGLSEEQIAHVHNVTDEFLKSKGL